jgi:DNA helicase-4
MSKYKMVIVDEYQDISRARYELLKNMRDSSNYDLFCVGDDWQSIYRFAGSDIGYIQHFSKYWGVSEISKIETTYRFPQRLIDITSSFITRNPLQLKKNIRGISGDSKYVLGEVNGYTDKYAIQFMLSKLDELPFRSSVFFIGRYKFDINMLDNNSELSYKYDNRNEIRKIKYAKRNDLDISYITAHKSKGLQADYVFILNNKYGKMGFPSKIQDSPILNLLLENSDTFPDAEERRLFYVAMTRAKKKVILVTLKDRESEFVNELHAQYAEEIKQERYICPLCGGKLKRKNGQYGEFFGCENYRTTGCRYIRNIKK